MPNTSGWGRDIKGVTKWETWKNTFEDSKGCDYRRVGHFADGTEVIQTHYVARNPANAKKRFTFSK